MKVNRSSWHYRWLSHVYWSNHKMYLKRAEPKSLCVYFWKTVFETFYFMFVRALLFTVVAAFPTALWSWLHNHSKSGAVLSFLYLGMMVGTTLIALGAFLFGKYDDWRIELKYKHVSKQLPPRVEKALSFAGVIKESIKAGKNKVCPMISYEGGSQ